MDFGPLKDFMNHLTSWRIPGNSISVCFDGKEVFAYRSGYADLENKIPMTRDRLFNIYSCSKVATVTAGLQLYERGKFLLDDPLYYYIPEYKDICINTPDGKIKAKNPITLRHLFTMTAGLTYNINTPAFAKAKEITNGKMNTLAVAKCLAEDGISFEPGTQWQYSLCHDVLGAVIEVISGKKFRDYMKENIFEPLEMYDTTYHPDEKMLSRMAEQYHFVDSNETDHVKMQSADVIKDFSGGHVVNRTKSNVDHLGEEYESGGGGIVTSVSDYSKFCAALARNGLGFNGEKILSAGSIDLLRTNQLVTPELMKNFNWSQLKGYGYGLGVRTLIDKAASGTTGNIGEFGWGGAAGATVLVDPEIKLSVFYAHHMLNPQESYYQPRLRNVIYSCIE